jgi:predicted TIM-barrel fold metal-dependent hydrolase
MTFSFVPTDTVAKVRDRLDHPVIDSDGHLIEFLPLVRDNVVDIAGESVASELDRMLDSGKLLRSIPVEKLRKLGRTATAWWGLPARNTLDRATVMFPQLLYQRLDEIGIDFAILYPTAGLTVTAYPGEELRRAMARACNRYYAEAYADYRDRLEPVAAIPCFTPDEALDEVRYAVGELGLKAVMLSGVIPRPVPGAEENPAARWIDTVGHDAAHDYEPLWAELDRLGVAATFHASGMGWGSRMSRTNYVYNHIGNFAAAGEATARSLFFAGVPRRYPNLRLAFQEGGIALACSLYADILGHYAKRNAEAIHSYNPEALDWDHFGDLVERFATGRARDERARVRYGMNLLMEPERDPARIDEFASTGIRGPEDVIDIFTRQYHFGCEADDPMNALAFNRELNPRGARLRAVFASDIGHWDVPDIRVVLPEAYELVEHGHLSHDDFREFVFGNAVSLWAGNNADFFRASAVETAVDKELAAF